MIIRVNMIIISPNGFRWKVVRKYAKELLLIKALEKDKTDYPVNKNCCFLQGKQINQFKQDKELI